MVFEKHFHISSKKCLKCFVALLQTPISLPFSGVETNNEHK